MPILQHGSAAQRDRAIPPLAQGHELAPFALTEAGPGSAAGAMRGRHDADAGTVTGTKQWITNGSYAHSFVVFAKDDGKPSAFLVRRGAPGFRVTREEEK